MNMKRYSVSLIFFLALICNLISEKSRNFNKIYLKYTVFALHDNIEIFSHDL